MILITGNKKNLNIVYTQKRVWRGDAKACMARINNIQVLFILSDSCVMFIE